MSMQTNRKRLLFFSAISLTDIVLLLLIFFLLSSSFIVQPGIKVNLPKAASAVPEEATQILITITANEQIFVNQKLVPKSDLGAELRRQLGQSPEKLVVIRADKDLKLQQAIDVVDVAKLAGAQRFMIATAPGL